MEEFNKIAAEYEFMDSLCSTLFDVKEKYYALLRAKANLQISENNVKINESFVKISRPGADLTTAKLNLNKAKIEHLEMINDYNNAKVDLINSMYLDKAPDFDIKLTQTFSFNNDYGYNKTKTKPASFVPEKFKFNRDKAVELAYESSPDLKALEATKKAMEQSLLYIKRSYLPDLTANVGYGYNNTNVESSNNSLQVGVNLSTSVNAMELKHSIKGADAQVNLADNEIHLFKKDLAYEIKRAFNNIEKSEKSINIAQINAQQALDNLKLVEDKYVSAELNYVALQDAREDYIHSVMKYAESLYDYNIALIQLEHAMHYHLVDIHHRSEHAMTHHSDDLIKHLNEALGCDEKETGKKLRFRKVKESL
jgi:outer membrane protein TolC